MNPMAIKIAQALKELNRSVQENGPKGLPELPVNSNETQDGKYEQDNLVDPGIKNPVTGTGSGPIIGHRGRATLRRTTPG
jgi:hypothetical protein